jgi:hypothetical protein
VSKDKTYDDNNDVIISIYQVLVLGNFDFEWKVNVKKFKIIGKNLPKNFQNIVLMPETMTFVSIEIKQEVVPKRVNP